MSVVQACLLSLCVQNGHDQVLNLTRYACQNISVAMAVVNKFGMSDFSPPLSLIVDGGTAAVLITRP